MTDEQKNDEVIAEAATTEEAPAEESATEETTPAEAENASEETPVADAEETAEEVEVPAEYKDIIEKIENMTVLELHGLVKTLEKKFGVSAAAVAVAGGTTGGATTEEKDSFTVHLASVGDSKIGVIKVVKEVLGLGLKEAKDLVESAPVDLKADVKKEEAEEMQTKLQEAGATIELK